MHLVASVCSVVQIRSSWPPTNAVDPRRVPLSHSHAFIFLAGKVSLAAKELCRIVLILSDIKGIYCLKMQWPNLRTMPWGLGNFFARVLADRHQEQFQPPVAPITKELSKHIDLWEFLAMDARPTMILDKNVVESNRYEPAKSPIVYRNLAFEKMEGSLDIEAFLVKLSNTSPGISLYMAGRVWGNYIVGRNETRDWVVVTADSTRYTENYSWVPAEGWINTSSGQRPAPDQEYQYVRRETDRSGMKNKDRIIPTTPILDWTRPSNASWLPKHYRTFQSVKWKETSLGKMTHWSSALRMVVNAVMFSVFQMILFWGPRYVMIYNEAYVDVARRRHPQLLGQALERAWPEAFRRLHGYLKQARSGKPVIRIGGLLPGPDQFNMACFW